MQLRRGENGKKAQKTHKGRGVLLLLRVLFLKQKQDTQMAFTRTLRQKTEPSKRGEA